MNIYLILYFVFTVILIIFIGWINWDAKRSMKSRSIPIRDLMYIMQKIMVEDPDSDAHTLSVIKEEVAKYMDVKL